MVGFVVNKFPVILNFYRIIINKKVLDTNKKATSRLINREVAFV